MCIYFIIPDSKIHGANVGPTWGRQDPGGPHDGHMNLAIWDDMTTTCGTTSWEKVGILTTFSFQC